MSFPGVTITRLFFTSFSPSHAQPRESHSSHCSKILPVADLVSVNVLNEASVMFAFGTSCKMIPSCVTTMMSVLFFFSGCVAVRNRSAVVHMDSRIRVLRAATAWGPGSTRPVFSNQFVVNSRSWGSSSGNSTSRLSAGEPMLHGRSLISCRSGFRTIVTPSIFIPLPRARGIVTGAEDSRECSERCLD